MWRVHDQKVEQNIILTTDQCLSALSACLTDNRSNKTPFIGTTGAVLKGDRGQKASFSGKIEFVSNVYDVSPNATAPILHFSLLNISAPQVISEVHTLNVVCVRILWGGALPTTWVWCNVYISMDSTTSLLISSHHHQFL